MKCKKLLSTILATAITVSSFAAMSITANAEGEAPAKKTMNMGSSVISASAENAKDRDIIYYGYNHGDAKKWRVLSTVGNTLDSDGDMVKFLEGDDNVVAKENALFVISENDFGERAFDINGSETSTQFPEYPEYYGSSIWKGSDAQKWCNGTGDGQFYEMSGMLGVEVDYILTTRKMDSPYENLDSYDECAINDKIFYLSANEVDTYFKDEEDRKFTPGGGNATDWWLRSSKNNDDERAGYVDLDGNVLQFKVTKKTLSLVPLLT